jgi:hypothetical protein
LENADKNRRKKPDTGRLKAASYNFYSALRAWKSFATFTDTQF